VAERVAVVVPVRDGERHLVEALRSVLDQDRPPDEVVVVDDGSRDGTARLAEHLGVRVVRQPPLGVSAARNRGVRETTAEVVAFLDHDDRWVPGKLRAQLAALAEEPDAGYCLAWMRAFLDEGCPRPEWLNEALLDRPLPGGVGGTLVARRWALDRVGGFDESMTHGEDTDWSVRAQELGIGAVHLEEVLLEYRLHGGNATFDRSAVIRGRMALLRTMVARRREASA
jgi:glycosyltransferase involved in cell wall biosynthesis